MNICPYCRTALADAVLVCSACARAVAVSATVATVGGAASDQTTFVPQPRHTNNAASSQSADAGRTTFVPSPANADRTTFSPPPADADSTTFVPATPAADRTTFVPPSSRPKTDRTPAVVGLDPHATRLPTGPIDSRDSTFIRVPGAPARTRLGDTGLLEEGTEFGQRYHIIKLLGVGGMGSVYQAWDKELGVAVALKIIKLPEDADESDARALEERFKRELLLARQVTHKSVVRIHDLGEIDGTKYITMTYVEGSDLSHILKAEGKLTVPRVLRIARQVLEGLAAAHNAGVVHRDLKPANIMIDADDQALIMDFGIALSSRDGKHKSEGIVGTLGYMSPQQATGQPVDQRTDLYALGLIMYDLLGGRKMDRDAESMMADMLGRIGKAPEPIRTVNPDVPEGVERVITKCLEPNVEARYALAADVLAAIDGLDENGIPIPVPPRFTRMTMAGAALAVVLVIGATWTIATRKPPPAPAPVSVLIGDFQNTTNDPTFDHMLEPVLRLALEGAGFISAYDRNGISRNMGVPPPEKLDERTATELAVKHGVGVVLTGSVDRQGNAYAVSVKAIEAVTGKVISSANSRAASKEQVLSAAGKLASTVRQALGDDTSDSKQLFAMDTVSATSLEVVRNYAAAMDALSNSRFEEAGAGFGKAVELDPNFGLGYAGLAVAAHNQDRTQDAQKYIKEAVRHLDSMTERERYRTRGLAFEWTSDYQACVKEFSDLIERYSSDAMARNNLAVCLTYLRELPKAIEEMRQAIKILPNRRLYHENLALYAAYSSDAQAAEEEARAIEKPSLFGLLPLAFAQILKGELPQAAEIYRSFTKFDQLGVSYAASGLGDLAIYEGRYSDAVKIFTEGAAADEAAKDADRAASKFTQLAHAQLLRQQKTAAIAAADKALAISQAVKIRFLAARIYAAAGAAAKARAVANSLASELQAEPQAYGIIVEGEAALQAGDARQAVKLLIEANKIFDTWLGHFALGRAYLGAEAFMQADAEFDRCIKRRGETLALFLDEEPTVGYLPPIYYYQGRVREGLKSSGFAEPYRAYLAIRGESKEDSLAAELRSKQF